MASPYVVQKVTSGYHNSEYETDLNCRDSKCQFSYAHWCPVCEVCQSVRCGRRRSKSVGLEADPLREHNRPYETPNYQPQHWKRRIVKEYDLRNCAHQHSTHSPYTIPSHTSERFYDQEDVFCQSMDVDGNMEHDRVPSKHATPIKKYREKLLPDPFCYQSKMYGHGGINIAQNTSLPALGENPKHFVVNSCDINNCSNVFANKGQHLHSPLHRKLHSDIPRKNTNLVTSSSWTCPNYAMPVTPPKSIIQTPLQTSDRREKSDSFLCPGGSDKVHPRQFSSPNPFMSHGAQDCYFHEVEVLRSKLRELRGAAEGKRLRQRSESEPGTGYNTGGSMHDCSREPKRPRDISPNLPKEPPPPVIHKGPSHRVRDAKLPQIPPKQKTGHPAKKVLPVTCGGDASVSSDSDFADDDQVCGSGEDGDSKGEPGEDSEEDDHSVMSSFTTLSSDSNTPSVVGETLGSISLNDSGKIEHPICNPPLSYEFPVRTKLPRALRASLFSYVPPYIHFSMHDAKVETLPPDLSRLLKWRLSTITPLVVRRTLTTSGFKLVRKSSDWCGVWGKHMKSVCFKTLKDFQKINHFPGTFQIGRKDRLWRNLYRLMTKFGKKEFGFIPRTYVLPHDSKLLRQAWERSCGREKWIIKPPASARGTGIKVVNRWAQIPKKRPLVVQKYISEPFLINGSKFDLRLYVLVTSINPLRIFIYDDGLVRFASVKYSGDMACINDRYMHLTNYSINKLSSQYTQNEDASACQGHKWTVKTLWTYLEKDGIDVKALWNSLVDLVIKTVISGESSITQLTRSNLTSRYCSYELFGIDVLLDESLKPWLLEVNISPSLHSSSPLDLAVKGPMVCDLLNMAGYQIPSKLTPTVHEELLTLYGVKDSISSLCFDKRLYTTSLSKEERTKHSTFEECCREEYLEDILRVLTPDDVRHLIQSEDEFTQAGRFIRIFPTSRTHVYHEFFESPRYYNLLFDAWETKYSNDRKGGITLLESLCRKKVHLSCPSLSYGTKSSASQQPTTTIDQSTELWNEKNEDKISPERKVLSLTSVALYRAARPRSTKAAVVMKPFPRSSYITKKTKMSSSSQPTVNMKSSPNHDGMVCEDATTAVCQC